MIQDNENKGKLIIFSAPSGAGKTTIVKHLLNCNLNLHFSISATSRKPRENEINGKDYFFISENDFRRKIQNNEFLEWEEVYTGIFYGSLKSEVEQIREKGGNVIFDVDVEGGVNIKKFYGKEALAVFVQPPSVKELENRLKKRSTESEEKINMRLAKAKHEMSYASRFDKILINKKLEIALKEAEILVREFLNG